MKVAVVQMEVAFGNLAANLATVRAYLDRVPADLVVFPECAPTGYAAATAEEAAQIAVPWPWGVALEPLQRDVDRLEKHVVVGFAAQREDGSLANVAALLAPHAAPRFYEKTHLPWLGFDRFARPGAELPVFDLPCGRVGILICYDQRFPEAARTLVLAGADLIVLPTNWPVGAETSANHISFARAAENKVFLATCNRAGIERGFRFIGRSRIIGPTGAPLAEAGTDAQILTAEIDLALAREKRTINIPGEYEIDVIGDRRPELYRT